MYSDNKSLYGLFTLDEMCKVVEECTQDYTSAPQSSWKRATTVQLLPAALHIYLQGPPALQAWYERKGWGRGPVLTVHIQQQRFILI